MDRDQIAQLAHDIAFALYRVAPLVEFSYLRKELEISAVGIVSFLDLESIDTAKRLIKLGRAIEEIGEVNSEVLLRELRNLTEMIGNAEFPEEREEIDVEKLFNRQKNTLPFKRQEQKAESKRQSAVKPGKRQTEILDFIRQFPGGCRAADITGNFPEVSKRTIRNDISALVEQNLAQRVGERGPYSYIKAADIKGDQGQGTNVNEILFLSHAGSGERESFDDY